MIVGSAAHAGAVTSTDGGTPPGFGTHIIREPGHQLAITADV
jgi:hypothetical protein